MDHLDKRIKSSSLVTIYDVDSDAMLEILLLLNAISGLFFSMTCKVIHKTCFNVALRCKKLKYFYQKIYKEIFFYKNTVDFLYSSHGFITKNHGYGNTLSDVARILFGNIMPNPRVIARQHASRRLVWRSVVLPFYVYWPN